MKDWTGNHTSSFATLGARNYAKEDRETHDYYATDPRAGVLLLSVEQFAPVIWECACGEGHLSKVFEAAGHIVISSDLVPRGYGLTADFLNVKSPPHARPRYYHKPALFPRVGVRGTRARTH